MAKKIGFKNAVSYTRKKVEAYTETNQFNIPRVSRHGAMNNALQMRILSAKGRYKL